MAYDTEYWYGWGTTETLILHFWQIKVVQVLWNTVENKVSDFYFVKIH